MGEISALQRTYVFLTGRHVALVCTHGGGGWEKVGDVGDMDEWERWMSTVKGPR